MKNRKQARLIATAAAVIVFLAAAVAANAQNIVKNGGFENPPVAVSNGQPYFSYGAKWNAFPCTSAFINDLGWTVEWRDDVKAFLNDMFVNSQRMAAPVAFLELQETGVYGVNSMADTGLQWAELDSDWTGPFVDEAAPNPPHRNGVPGTDTEVTSISIYQTLNTLPGMYELSFALAARPGTGTLFGADFQNRLEVIWNGQKLLFAGVPYVQAVAPANTTDPIVWTRYTAMVTATGFETELRFTDIGLADSFGSFLDSVVVIPAGDGCTKTQGYWKTHSIYGPASTPDPTWNKVGELGPDALFLNTGMTWYQILNVAPKGNPYYILAHQYIAAELNRLSGASLTKNVNYADLQNALSMAHSLLSVPPTAVSKKDGQPYVAIADFLTQYNEGAIGPGHCFDEPAPVSSSTGNGGNANSNGRSAH